MLKYGASFYCNNKHILCARGLLFLCCLFLRTLFLKMASVVFRRGFFHLRRNRGFKRKISSSQFDEDNFIFSPWSSDSEVSDTLNSQEDEEYMEEFIQKPGPHIMDNFGEVRDEDIQDQEEEKD